MKFYFVKECDVNESMLDGLQYIKAHYGSTLFKGRQLLVSYFRSYSHYTTGFLIVGNDSEVLCMLVLQGVAISVDENKCTPLSLTELMQVTV